MKNRKQYEVYFLKQYFLKEIKNQLSPPDIWMLRTLNFINIFFKTTDNDKSLFLDYLDFSLNNLINLYIISPKPKLLKYLSEIPGFNYEAIDEIKKNAQKFKEYQTLSQNKPFKEIFSDQPLLSLIEMNDIDTKIIKNIIQRKPIKNIETKIRPEAYRQQDYISYYFKEPLKKFNTNYKFSSFSKENHFFINLLKKHSIKEIKKFIHENNIDIENITPEEHLLIQMYFN